VTFKPDSKLTRRVHVAANVEARRGGVRPSLLIMHYTGMSSAEKAIDWLAREESRVSCHYVIDEVGLITQLVPENMRAWHAGVSYWRGETDINSHSIGIEIQNPGHEDGYPNFPPRQMNAVIALAKDIVRRHKMKRGAVLAHSDVAPSRKIDPGEKFNWAALARHGLGDWVRPSPVDARDKGLGPGARSDRIGDAQRLLSLYGYEAPTTGVIDDKTTKALRAFQLHFRRQRIDGRLDRSTFLTLLRLIDAAGLGKPA
jgi:N-acetylmuramoyl-L-alanine amidase